MAEISENLPVRYSNPTYNLSRIDRSVADNLRDIERSFPMDGGVVKDFIVFITMRLKKDMFGFASFTLNQFCKDTGRNRQQMCDTHPFFTKNPTIQPPVYNGHVFKSVFDYGLLNMMKHNLIFEKPYNFRSKDGSVELGAISVLKEIRLNPDRVNGTVKLYTIRLSQDILDGFFQRFYTIDPTGYSKIGKGRGGDGRKSLYILIEKTRHILQSQRIPKTKFAVDYIASVAEIKVKEPKNRKTSVKRVLSSMQKKAGLDFDFEFKRGDETNRYQEDYWVELTFNTVLLESKGDTTFFMALIEELKAIFNSSYKNLVIEGEKDVFQRWLNNTTKDADFKAQAVTKAFFKGYNRELTISEAKTMVLSGSLWEDICMKINIESPK